MVIQSNYFAFEVQVFLSVNFSGRPDVFVCCLCIIERMLITSSTFTITRNRHFGLSRQSWGKLSHQFELLSRKNCQSKAFEIWAIEIFCEGYFRDLIRLLSDYRLKSQSSPVNHKMGNDRTFRWRWRAAMRTTWRGGRRRRIPGWRTASHSNLLVMKQSNI